MSVHTPAVHPATPPATHLRLLRRLRRRLREGIDAIVASDPGLNRLLSALQLMLGVAVTIAVVFGFVQLTHAMWISAPAGAALSPAQAAELDLQHRGVTLLAMILGGLIAMMSAMAVLDVTPREQAKTMVLMPVPMLATMALSIERVPHRTAGIVLMALVMGVGTYARKFVPRFGPRAFLYGQLLFIGYLFGFLSRGAIHEDQLGWIAAALWVAVLVNLALKLGISRPLQRGATVRAARAFSARCRGVIATAVELFDAEDGRQRERARRRLHRRLTHLNETALVIDAMLGAPGTLLPGASAAAVHDRLFETELVVQNIGRLVEALAAADLPAPVRVEVRRRLIHLRAGRNALAAASVHALEDEAGRTALERLSDRDRGRIQRLVAAMEDWGTVAVVWAERERQRARDEPDTAPFESAVTLIFGNLPGSTLVSSAAASPEEGERGSLGARLGLAPAAQTGIRIALAVGVASAVGSTLSDRRFYWAVIAVFITFMGANTAGEQIAKAGNRVLGTVVGIMVGALVAHEIGRSPWSIVVIVVALGIGVYFVRANYAIMVIGVTVMVSLLYEQLGEYSNHLLLLRLEETAIGAVIAVLAALTIFPVRTRRATTIAAHGYLTALEGLLDQLVDRLGAGAREGDEDARPASLTGAARGLDHASQQLRAAALPLSRSPFRRDRLEHNLGLFGQATYHVRNVVADVERDLPLQPHLLHDAVRALQAQRDVVGRLGQEVNGGSAEPTVDAVQHAEDRELRARLDHHCTEEDAPLNPDQQHFLRHLDRLDETLAELRDNLRSHQPLGVG